MGTIHAGDISDPATKAGRLFEVMKTRPGEWWDALELQSLIGISTAIGTRVSEIRFQAARFGFEVPKCKRKNGLSYYMIRPLVCNGEQMRLF